MTDKELFGISEQLNDTISRAAVVDAIEGVDWYHINRNGEMVHGANDAEHQAWYKADDIYAAIERVPSAQPVAKDINVPVKDCISRQAAIDALDVLCQEHRYKIPGKIETYSQYNEAWQDALDRAEGAIFNLPSAQPEIIRCKDCKHWTNNIGDSKLRDNYCNDEAHGFYYQCSEDDYCSFAERRTDE